MTVFHEIYGLYFRIVRQLLKHPSLTEREVQDTVLREGFRDTVLFLPQKLLPQPDGSDWELLHKNADGTLSPATRNEPPQPLSLLQKRWLRTRLDDPRMGLFLDGDEIDALRGKFADVRPLYTPETVRYTDQFADGDAFGDAAYQEIFREILTAIRRRNVLHLVYESGHQRRLKLHVVPFRLEYSEKNDKLRVYCQELRRGSSSRCMLLNLGRIRSLRRSETMYPQEISAERCFRRLRCKEPVTVRVKPERNAVERFLMEFACYEKRTDRDVSTGILTVQLWYDQIDETELLIRLLGFGPVLEILSPADFRAKAADRIRKQLELLGTVPAQ